MANSTEVPVCPYCSEASTLVGGDKIYPHRPDLAGKRFWLCEPCNAYVGCHPGTTTPLGRLADVALRQSKMAAHAAFDPIWKTNKMRRSEAYAWLAEKLGLPADDCHIGMFDVERCQLVIKNCRDFMADILDEPEYQFHFSERGIPLVWITAPIEGEIILTTENYLKWYGLYLLHSDGKVEMIPFPDDDWAKPGETAYGDHVPNPHVVQRFVEKKGYLLDDQALEMIIGRWELEHEDAAGTKYGCEEEQPPV